MTTQRLTTGILTSYGLNPIGMISYIIKANPDGWHGQFAKIVQNIIDEVDSGQRNAFSVFMSTEQHRCFSEALSLRL